MLSECGEHVHHQLIGMRIVRRDEIDATFDKAGDEMDISSRVALGFLAAAMAAASWGRSDRRPLSTSQNSPIRSPAWLARCRKTASRWASKPRPDVVHSSLYLPEPVYEALREAAFKERCKIHDLVMQGIDLALRKRGYPSVDDLRAGRKR